MFLLIYAFCDHEILRDILTSSETTEIPSVLTKYGVNVSDPCTDLSMVTYPYAPINCDSTMAPSNEYLLLLGRDKVNEYGSSVCKVIKEDVNFRPKH